jgi:hypothetical protein
MVLHDFARHVAHPIWDPLLSYVSAAVWVLASARFEEECDLVRLGLGMCAGVRRDTS